LEKARITRPNPNFQKTQITETRENENFGKNCLSQGPTLNKNSTECVTDLDLLSEMIISESLLITFEASFIFLGTFGI